MGRDANYICRVELCTELFYAILPDLVSLPFADLLSLHHVIRLHVAPPSTLPVH